MRTLWRFFYWRGLLARIVQLLPGDKKFDIHGECFRQDLVDLIGEYEDELLE